MVFLILIAGLIGVRIFSRITEEWNEKVCAFVSTVIACLIGLWALSLDVNSFESAINAILVIPAMLGVGTSMMAVTLGWTSDGGVWSESFSIGSTSYGRTTGRMSLTSMIFLVLIASSAIFLFLMIFSGYFVFIIFYVVQAFLLLKVLFRKD